MCIGSEVWHMAEAHSQRTIHLALAKCHSLPEIPNNTNGTLLQNVLYMPDTVLDSLCTH